MKGLLIADFKRVFKDKMMIVLGILAVVFAAMNPLLNGALGAICRLFNENYVPSVTAKAMFFMSFNLGDVMGLVAAAILAGMLCKDFSYGTIRNKIIAGKSRSAIFFSLFITCSAVFVAVMLLNAAASLGISLCLFDYQSDPFTAADFWYAMESLGFSLLVLLFGASLLSTLCVCMKKGAIVIVTYLSIAFGMNLVATLLVGGIELLDLMEGSKKAIDILTPIARINVFGAVNYIGTGTAYTWKDVLYLTVPAVVGILGMTGFGYRQFGKKDLK